MSISDFLEKANKGVFEIDGVRLEIIINKDRDGDDFVKVKMYPITELHDEAWLGCKWLKYIEESEFLDFEKGIRKHKEKAFEFYKKAQRVVNATITKDGRIKVLDLPDDVKSDWCFYENEQDREKAIKRFIKNPHNFSMFEIGFNYMKFFAIGEFSLNIDGVIYKPHWSYWLERPYYIKEMKGE